MACGEGFLVSFDPLKLKANNAIPNTILTSISILNEPNDSLLFQDDLTLTYRQNFVSFEFSALAFTNGDMNQFKYQLEGVDQNWVFAENRNFAAYSDLKPGDYTFKVCSSNNHKLWNENPAVFAFTISPPFWKEPLFISLVTIFIISMLFFFYQLRVKRLKEKQRLRMEVAIEAQEKERNRLAVELHDDLGTKMSTLKLFLNSLEQQENNNDRTKLINANAQQLLDGSIAGLRTVLSDLSPTTLHKQGLFPAIEELISPLNQSGKMEVFFHSDNQRKRVLESIELAVFRVVQELINNAIKHANCSQIVLKLTIDEDTLELNYEDNGIGFPAEIQNQGYGIRNIKQRIEFHHGTAVWMSKNAESPFGTAVLIRVPLKRKS